MGRKLIYLTLFFILLHFVSGYLAKQLPDPQKIKRSLVQMPKQSSYASIEDFEFDYREEIYLVYP